MIPVDNTQTISSAGAVQSIGKVTTTAKNIPFLINAVTDRIYKDKPGAIVREYNTNAWDEHIKAKLPIADIQVTLPTLDDPVMRIRDFGPGLTMEQVRDVYCILGESTKRGSNDLNGQLGLGCKSAFGYGDSFMVTSCVNGKKTIYNIIKGDDTKEGDVLRMSEEDMTDDKTGIEVSIPIKVNDLHTIHAKAADFFKYWIVLPSINRMDETELARMNRWRNSTPFLSGEGWEIRPNSNSYGGSGRSVAVMGQVAYPIDWNMLRSKMALTPQRRIFTEILQSNDVVLQFPIGSLKFTINREELEYTETTYKNLENKIERIFATLENAVVDKFTNAKTIWEAKRIYLALFGKNIGDQEDGDDSVSEDKALKMLDGDFYRLEDMFEGKLFWNGIKMDSPHFSAINRFDCDFNTTIHTITHSPSIPCMASYRKKKTRVKKLRCTDTEHNRITPYNGVKVILIDGRNVSMMQTIARYYLLRDGTGISKVHILRFADDAQRDSFFKEYNFETAEYTLLSSVIDEIKAWQKANRKSYSRGGGGGGGTTMLKYIDVASGSIETSEVNLRDLDDGGVFLSYSRKDAQLPGPMSRKLEYVASEIHELSLYADLNLDRVYCLPEGKLEAKWFQKAKSEGLWTEFISYLKENGDVIVTDKMRRSFHYNKYRTENDEASAMSPHYAWAKAISDKLCTRNAEFDDYLDAIVDQDTDFEELNHALRVFGLRQVMFGNTSPVDFAALATAIMDKYPLLKFMDICEDDDVDEEKLRAIVGYIESMNQSRKSLTTEAELV